jgi:hypothetical protein
VPVRHNRRDKHDIVWAGVDSIRPIIEPRLSYRSFQRINWERVLRFDGKKVWAWRVELRHLLACCFQYWLSQLNTDYAGYTLAGALLLLDESRNPDNLPQRIEQRSSGVARVDIDVRENGAFLDFAGNARRQYLSLLER